MAYASTLTDFYPKGRVLTRIGAWFSRSMAQISENEKHLKHARHLQGLTDAQLAEKRIKRQDIVRVAFQDVYYT